MFAVFLIRRDTRIRFISYVEHVLTEPIGRFRIKKMLSPSLIDALGQIMTGLKHIGDGVTYLIGFILNALGVSASQQLIQMATILILLAVVWKIGSKLTSSVFWFFIIAQAMSFLGTS